jgi:hypothetical protein
LHNARGPRHAVARARALRSAGAAGSVNALPDILPAARQWGVYGLHEGRVALTASVWDNLQARDNALVERQNLTANCVFDPFQVIAPGQLAPASPFQQRRCEAEIERETPIPPLTPETIEFLHRINIDPKVLE